MLCFKCYSRRHNDYNTALWIARWTYKINQTYKSSQTHFVHLLKHHGKLLCYLQTNLSNLCSLMAMSFPNSLTSWWKQNNLTGQNYKSTVVHCVQPKTNAYKTLVSWNPVKDRLRNGWRELHSTIGSSMVLWNPLSKEPTCYLES